MERCFFLVRGDDIERCSWFRIECTPNALHQRGVTWCHAKFTALIFLCRPLCVWKRLVKPCLPVLDERRLSWSYQGIATREDIDTTLKLGMNHPMGPLQLGMPLPISTLPN